MPRDDCTSVVHLYLLFILLSVSCGRPRIRSGLTVSHNEPVMCCGFSEEFRQVVSCCEGSVSKQPSCLTQGKLCLVQAINSEMLLISDY